MQNFDEEDSYAASVQKMLARATSQPTPAQHTSGSQVQRRGSARIPLIIGAALGIVVLFILAVLVAKVILTVVAVLAGFTIFAGMAASK
jgi:Flp pilus assembly protein TadB